MLQRDALRLGQALLTQERARVGGGSLPCRLVTAGDARIGMARRLADRGERRRRPRWRRLLQAKRGRGIEETIGEHADVQRSREAGEQRAPPIAVGDHGGQRIELIRGGDEPLECRRAPHLGMSNGVADSA